MPDRYKDREIRVVLCGLGPVGCNIYRYLSRREGIKLAGVVDTDASKIGRDVAEVSCGSGNSGIEISGRIDEILRKGRVDVAVISTVSGVGNLLATVLEMLEAGINVVSTCEELSYPWQANPAIAESIDKKAREKGVSVLGTGVNPGFLMDFLPLVMTGVCRSVSQITVERFQDASLRRAPFQKKIGVGLTPEEFKDRAFRGELKHVGLVESMHMIACSTGFQIVRFTEEVEPLVAGMDYVEGNVSVKAGQVLGLRQTGRAFSSEGCVIELVFHAEAGCKDPYDRIYIDAEPPIDMILKNGVNGDIATANIAVNVIPFIKKTSPGLKTMADIEPAFFIAS